MISGYTRCKFIESTGTQYIDTGYTPNLDTKFILDYELTAGNSGNVHIATATTGGSTPIYAFMSDSNAMTYHARYGTGRMLAFGVSGAGRFNLVRDKETSSLNGSKITAESETFTTGTTITLCGKNNGTSVSNLSRMKIYSCQIYDNDILVRDYIPAVRYDGKAGLYDLISDVFYTNVNGSNFFYEADMSFTEELKHKGYTLCSYIESTGTQYIDTGYKPNNTSKVVMDVKSVGTNSNYTQQTYFGAHGGSVGRFSLSWHRTQSRFYMYYNTGNAQFNNPQVTDRAIVTMDNNVATIGDSITLTATDGNFQSAYSMYLCAMNYTDTANYFGVFRVYGCQIYDNGELVRDYVPVLEESTGLYGLYDMANNVFYSSATDNFNGAILYDAQAYKTGFRRGLMSSKQKSGSTVNTDLYCTVRFHKPLTVKFKGSNSSNVLEYCVNGDGNWLSLPDNTNITFDYSTDSTISFRGTCVPIISNGIGTFTFSSTQYISLEGNCNALLFGDLAADKFSIYAYSFYRLFNGVTRLISVSRNFLPATELAESCYEHMFSGCNMLTTAPELPATTLANYCYSSMFRSCTSLTNAPELPTTELADYCYEYMFSNCPNLTIAPELPATELARSCYYGMFDYCISLTNAPELPATTLAYSCYEYMFSGCSSLVAPALPATTLAERCYYGMFCDTDLTIAPELPATTLADNCYSLMFHGCRLLVTAPALPATTLAEGCYSLMFEDCTNLTIAPELPATELARSCYYGMFYSSSLVATPALPATTLASSCYEHMFSGCSSLVTTIELPATTLAYSCYKHMFSNCTSLVTAPALPATELVDYCYQNMFSDCSSLINAPELPATKLAYNCYKYMFSNCTSLVTAPALPATTLAANCYEYMFYYCTSLINAPTLPATTVTNECYSYMFSYCTNLTTAPALPATTLATYCYERMFEGCRSLTNAPELPATKLANYCYESMFQRCIKLTIAPALPATTLATYCYYCMFNGCSSLTTAPALPATTLATYCYYGMFEYCTSLVTAPALPATTLVNYCYRSMFSGCSSLNNIVMLATDISAYSCLSYWVSGVKLTGTFTKNANMTSLPSGINGIPSGWTVKDYVA